MKYLLVCLLLFLPTLCFADHLTCNPVPANSWDGIGMIMDGKPEIIIPPTAKPDGTQILWYDISGLTPGNHNVILRGRKGVVWSPTTPFDFSISVPSLTGIKIDPN